MEEAKTTAQGGRDEQGNLIAFERPTKTFDLDRLGDPTQVVIPRVLFGEDVPENGAEKWDATVSWGRRFDEMAGTVVYPGQFVSGFEIGGGMSGEEAVAKLLGSDVSMDGRPLVQLTAPFCVMNFYAGSNCGPAIKMSQLGSRENAYSDGASRLRFQLEFNKIARFPYAWRPGEVLSSLGLDPLSGPVWLDRDDVGASGVTYRTAAAIVEEVVGLDKFAARQISAGVMTAHSISDLAIEAGRQGLWTQIDVGMAAWGMTEGIGPNKEHRNYIATVDGVDSEGKGLFVVGDVGEAARRTKSPAWDLHRTDGYWDSREEAGSVVWNRLIPRSHLLTLYAYGGLLVRALSANVGGIEHGGFSEIISRGSRVETDDGFSAVFSGFVEPLRAWAAMQ